MPARSFRLGLIALVSFCWLLLTFPVALKYMGRTGWFAVLVGEASVLGLLALVPSMRARGRDVPGWVLPVIWIMLATAYLAVYPHTQNLSPGRGTDREDALRVQILAIQHHQDPYAVRTFLGQLPTPLPGAIAMAWPFYLLGRISIQNLLWSALFCIALRRMYRLRVTAVVFFLVVVCLNMEPLNDFVSGSDYVLNAMYVALAMWLVLRSVHASTPAWQLALSSLFLGMAISSRPSYFMTAPPMVAFVTQRRGLRTGLVFSTIVAAAFAATIIPVFWPHPVSGLFAELNEISHRKTHLLPAALPIQAISVTSLLIALSAFFVKLNRFRVFLMAALATAVLIGVPMGFEVADALRQGQAFPVESLYLFTPILFFAFWGFHRLEAPPAQDR